MPMHSLLEYSKNYSKTSGSLWKYYRDELADGTNDDDNPNKNVDYILQEVLIMLLKE